MLAGGGSRVTSHSRHEWQGLQMPAWHPCPGGQPTRAPQRLHAPPAQTRPGGQSAGRPVLPPAAWLAADWQGTQTPSTHTVPPVHGAPGCKDSRGAKAARLPDLATQQQSISTMAIAIKIPVSTRGAAILLVTAKLARTLRSRRPRATLRRILPRCRALPNPCCIGRPRYMARMLPRTCRSGSGTPPGMGGARVRMRRSGRRRIPARSGSARSPSTGCTRRPSTSGPPDS
jgi:hypothetical protein